VRARPAPRTGGPISPSYINWWLERAANPIALRKEQIGTNYAAPVRYCLEEESFGVSRKYETPDDIVHDNDLTIDEKIEMLESWREDKESYLRASDEGMQGCSRSELLRLIDKATADLRENSSR
jgi:hypothetical protein